MVAEATIHALPSRSTLLIVRRKTRRTRSWSQVELIWSAFEAGLTSDDERVRVLDLLAQPLAHRLALLATNLAALDAATPAELGRSHPGSSTSLGSATQPRPSVVGVESLVLRYVSASGPPAAQVVFLDGDGRIARFLAH